MSAAHPTPLQLDALFLGEPLPELAAHVSACESCSRYLERLRAPIALPSWLREVEPPRTRRLWSIPALAIAGMIFAVWLTPPASTLRAKTAPGIAVYARQGEHVTLWDGRSPFRAGDAIRFEIDSGDLHSVALVTHDARVIYQDELAGTGPALLPLSLTFDAEPGPEGLVVVLSRSRLPAEELLRATRELPRDQGVWTTRFVFPKHPVKEGTP
jgi:hypothetical protein